MYWRPLRTSAGVLGDLIPSFLISSAVRRTGLPLGGSRPATGQEGVSQSVWAQLTGMSWAGRGAWGHCPLHPTQPNPQTAQANTPPQPRGLRDCIITDDCTVLITATGTSQPRHSNPPPGSREPPGVPASSGPLSSLPFSRQERGHQKRAGLSYSNPFSCPEGCGPRQLKLALKCL